MRTLRVTVARFLGLFNRSHRAADFDAELESHLQLHIDDNLRAGMSPAEARRQALLHLGSVVSTREAYRDRGGVPWLEHFLRDLRFAARQLRRQPAFALTAIFVLAVGLAASLAIFSFVDAALVRPLPYPNPDRLMSVMSKTTVFPRSNLSYLDYLDWRQQNTVFESLEAYTGSGFLLRTPSGTEPVTAARVSAGFFRALDIRPLLGRDFADGEDRAGAPPVVLISYGTWQSRFGGRRDLVGQSIALSGEPFTVIGILPASFQFAPRGNAEFWTPLNPGRGCMTRRECHNLDGLARLKPGVTQQAALAHVLQIAQQLERQYPDSNRGQSATVDPLADVIQGRLRPILLLLLGGAGLLLLIAYLNVASLLLERAENRRREMAVRVALGASTVRTVSQFATEGLLLVLAATVVALVTTHWVVQLMLALIPKDLRASMPYFSSLGLNSHVLIFAALVALAGALVFSLTPALYLGWNPRGLAEGSRGSAGMSWRRLGSRLVVVELVTAVVLLAGAGLLGRSLYRLLNVNLGFAPDHLATLYISAPQTRYREDPAQAALARRVVEVAAALPGVRSAAVTSVLPVNFNGNTMWIRIVGQPFHGEHNEVNQRDISPGYFTTIGAKLNAGRYFNATDDRSRPRVSIINQTLADRYFPGVNPIGQRIGTTDLLPASLSEVVGVVADVRDGPLDADVWPAIYFPFEQRQDTSFSLIVRTAASPGAILPSLAAAVRGIDLDLGLRNETTMDVHINDSAAAYLHRSSAWLVGGFALLALLLSAVGLYGVVAYSVSQRRREIGIRMALGAEQGSVCRMVLSEAGWLAALGITLGSGVSLGAVKLFRDLPFQLSTWDWSTFAAVASLLAVCALVASYLPARRAASVDPVDALRAE